MKRWVIAVLFSMVMCIPAVAAAEDTTFDPGRGTRIEVPLFEIPFGANTGSGTIKKKDDTSQPKEKDLQAKKEEKAKAALDKKVDDAIKRACGTDTSSE